MKRIAIVAAAMAFAGAAAAQDEVKVGVAAEPYPPFTSPDASGNWAGWEIDMMNAVCAEAGLDCVVTPVAWDGIIPALTSGRIDMIFGSMSITDERKQSIDFSDKYYDTPSVIVGLRDVAMEPNPGGLDGRSLGVQVATTHQSYAAKHFAPAGIEVREYQTQDEANQDLVAGRIDATQADGLAMQDFLATPEGEACCEMKGPVPGDAAVLGAGIGAGLRQGEDELREKINGAIEAIRANGTYDEISNRYFTIDIYGG